MSTLEDLERVARQIADLEQRLEAGRMLRNQLIREALEAEFPERVVAARALLAPSRVHALRPAK